MYAGHFGPNFGLNKKCNKPFNFVIPYEHSTLSIGVGTWTIPRKINLNIQVVPALRWTIFKPRFYGFAAQK
jgi:hypothetical protein